MTLLLISVIIQNRMIIRRKHILGGEYIMKYSSVFDVIGPVMIGPSSSHTAGAARIGKAARDFFGKEPTYAKIHLYGSFAKTYKGHGTDFALAGGLLGFDTDDKRMSSALEICKDQGIDIEFIEEEASTDHPNTARLIVGDQDSEIEIVGISLGGGTIEIVRLNGLGLRQAGCNPGLSCVYNDKGRTIGSVRQIFDENRHNIGHRAANRKEVSQEALMVIETDDVVREEVIEQL